MSVTLRVILIISSFLAFLLCITKIKQSKLNKIYVLATYTAMINYRKYLFSKGYIKKLW